MADSHYDGNDMKDIDSQYSKLLGNLMVFVYLLYGYSTSTFFVLAKISHPTALEIVQSKS